VADLARCGRVKKPRKSMKRGVPRKYYSKRALGRDYDWEAFGFEGVLFSYQIEKKKRARPAEMGDRGEWARWLFEMRGTNGLQGDLVSRGRVEEKREGRREVKRKKVAHQEVRQRGAKRGTSNKFSLKIFEGGTRAR